MPRMARVGIVTHHVVLKPPCAYAGCHCQSAYQYDGAGHRVAKINCPSGMSTCTAATSSASMVWYVYDAAKNLAAEYGVSSTATASPCTTCYLMDDHLGSTRMMTDQNENSVATKAIDLGCRMAFAHATMIFRASCIGTRAR